MANESAATPLLTSSAADSYFPYSSGRRDAKWSDFAKEIDAIGENIRQSIGPADYKQFSKFALWGRLATATGYATAWIIPNPISAGLIGLGNYTRWSLIFHQVSHKAMDRVPGVPERYTSKHFATGRRRYRDWFDWISPTNWAIEHNLLHHYHLGAEGDPDIVWRNSRFIRELKAPKVVRYILALLVACIWKPFYYAPNTLAEARFHRRLSPTNKITWRLWVPITPEGRELWLKSLLPYGLFKFVFLPALFFPLGQAAVYAVFINSVLGELVANVYSFAMIGPNHTGEDIYLFSDSAKSRGDFYIRQIIGTVNFRRGGDFTDFIYGGMNYQIEHHLWPEAPLYQCRRVQPRLKTVCEKYGVPYRQSAMLPRLVKTIRMMAGEGKPLKATVEIDTGA
ncbi:MAG: fatty acid desaturase [Proteobacteria bacterium]|nr:MAG: fatty acid desaturase [Pseudomonadota bacterium]